MRYAAHVLSFIGVLQCYALALTIPKVPTRRAFLAGAAAAAASTALPVQAETLQQRIQQRHFEKPLFSIPPKEVHYPAWMEGLWDVTAGFNGYLFPNKKVSKEAVVANEYTPGFKQLSILSNADIGPASATFQQRFIARGGSVVDDKVFNLPAAMRGWLKEKAPAVLDHEYDPASNPNRFSLVLSPSGSIPRSGAGTTRVELFTNFRESSTVGDDTFLLSDLQRQVTVYRPGADVIARELIADYQQFWVYRRQQGGSHITANLLTAGYLQPQDANYFDSPKEPVILYSHTYNFQRATA